MKIKSQKFLFGDDKLTISSGRPQMPIPIKQRFTAQET